MKKLPMENKTNGFFNSNLIKKITFYIIIICIFCSVFASVLAIWDFAKPDVFWRLIATFLVIALGAWLFSIVNGLYGNK